MVASSTTRFSSRVEQYVKYRPHYPKAVLDALIDNTGLQPRHAIADIGSGTGFSAELFLGFGNLVYGIEPNREMREAGEKYLETYKNFRSVDGTAEVTTLPDASVDYILAGQAFHWFKEDAAYSEFERILRPNGWLVLMWNDRQTDSTPFLIDYEALLQKFGTDYNEINHRNFDSSRIKRFYRGKDVMEFASENNIAMDYEGLEGRLLSSSYVPSKGEPHFEEMIKQLRTIFERHQSDGMIEMRYTTLVFSGQL